ncbi:hypothetical protein ABFS82_14G211000 [Erythranthe guttata]|uniref:Uncharacterized protein n=2 Tax=Erythranthe guttata TaxID=4155 RepID=A0A022PR87_ERYGU|nr:PREDICTED: uncharacterized protein LOC105950212 isoform X1 [Erythranthe guttata]EYU17984.1 hypothetical protein MIMGU_mgv1a004685mg [Erythranthe guttata]|eukprot:XP_012829008.1 PREDICTED: uncharacterized protein LOC105950212 isoform X1 [Erythranthe guttata]
MAEYMAIPSNVKLHFNGNVLEEQLVMAKTSHLQARRSFYYGSNNVNRFSSWKALKHAPLSKILKGTPGRKTHMTCYCSSALASANSVLASDWVPLMDQILLLASITLTYMAGVIPVEKSPYSTQMSTPLGDVVPGNSSSSGSEVANDGEVRLQFAWDVVKRKLVDSLSAVKNGVNLSERVSEIEQKPAKQPSSLSAIAEGPRIRLLWASFQCLNKEVANISTNPSTNSKSDLLAVFAEIIQKCCQPVCMAWLEEELRLISSKPDKELLSLAKNKLNGYGSIIQSIRKLGKEDLYAELVYALKFGSSRKGGYYNSSLFIQHGVDILEDLLITLADGIASMYLELISVDSSLSNEMNNLGLSLCTLSTRALQRLRNEVALHQWMHQNMEAVVSMFEDQFDLCTLQTQLVEESSSSEAENFGWWKKLSINRSGPVSSSLQFVAINQISVPVKRTMELRALTGWKYYFSLFLELADITMPFVRTVVTKASDAISFFLVCLIGRSVGLIYSGIRNSLRRK